MEAVCSTDMHPNAEWVYARVRPKFPDISLGTVYRNLSLFKEEGNIVCVGNVNGQERYDANTRPHAHFICKSCGSVADLHDAPPPAQPDVEGQVEGWQLSFFGTCSNCSQKQAMG